jgi:EAL domain-containing protein (putative c-di-GMP-specific phosphodiesterase class I)
LVDDEPAIHDVSRLLLADVAFEGRPIELLSAHSANEARRQLERSSEIALVLLDVVMETDDAGLTLVRHIRDQLHDRDIQIVLRTGQPGMAPERDVILRYDINGYFLKTEITAQKLYSIVISSLRAFRYIRSLRVPTARPPRFAQTSTRDVRHARLEAEIASAMHENEFVVLTQAEIALESNEPVGVELIPQWKTGEGILSAARVAEVLASAPQLRRDVALRLLRLACSSANSWQSVRSLPIQVSIPLLGEELADCDLLGAIRAAMSESAITTGMLDLQIPETVLQGDRPLERETLLALQSQGVSITLVDFGSGVISLPLLYRLQPNRLKIHRTFVRGVTTDAERTAVARSIIALAHTLGIVAIADGITSDTDLQFFKWEGCDDGAGDLLAPATTLSEFAQFLATGKLPTH